MGGGSRPWQVIVSIEGMPVPYVVKLYKKEYIDNYFTVAKEVYASIIASQLKINTPSPALIDFPNEFISSLPSQLQDELYSKDQRLKFGTKLITGSFQYIDTLPLNKYNLIDSIYAFDNLIKNGDRRHEKPNILLKGKEIFAIDHEISFTISNAIEQFKENIWVYNKEAHIFYRHLKNKSIGEKKLLFSDFKYYLTQIDFNILDSYFEQLRKIGHDNDYNYSQIKAYLCEMKRNAEKFVQQLKSHLG